jgi:uncharacterized damage-inducible protein DinB
MNILKLLEYNQFLRHKYLETISELPWAEVIKDRNASFSSLRDIFVHIIFVVDAYVSIATTGVSTYPSAIDFNAYDNIGKIKKHLEQVESKAGAYLAKVTPEELKRNVERKLKDGTTILLSVEDLLLDFFQEETHHRGELLALLWQMDVTPPHMGFGQYLRMQKQK